MEEVLTPFKSRNRNSKKKLLKFYSLELLYISLMLPDIGWVFIYVFTFGISDLIYSKTNQYVLLLLFSFLGIRCYTSS